MSLRDCTDKMLPALEAELQRQVRRIDQDRVGAFHEMLKYHMGWTGQETHATATGKRVRPLLLLLVASALGKEWVSCLPGAAAVEIVHNFSLVHDDIQDNSPTRRGRPALWAKYGMPMAINAGDALLTIAHLAMLDLKAAFRSDIVLRCAAILQQACLDLTLGQFMDLASQRQSGLTLEDYWAMVGGKTAALLSASAQIGALLVSEDEATAQRFGDFGRALGLAFQVQDDILGIWGDEALTGKSTASDLVEGKSSLPILYGMSRDARFAERWLAGPLGVEEVPAMAQRLSDAGARDYALQECHRLTEDALAILRASRVKGPAGAALVELTSNLAGRAT